jgi:protein-S-isoprenylcysteine O-methyltransferase Ste14
MRNPIRVKNLRLRFAPLYGGALALLLVVEPGVTEYATGACVIALGAALRSWGAGHLVKTAELTTTGPYAHLRHPLYLGTLLAGSGVALMAGGVWALGVLALFVPWFFGSYFPRKERTESARLREIYGEAFSRYRDAVPALWPRWTAWRPEAAGAKDAARWSFERYSDNNELGTLLGLVALVAVFGVRTAWAAGGA